MDTTGNCCSQTEKEVRLSAIKIYYSPRTWGAVFITMSCWEWKWTGLVPTWESYRKAKSPQARAPLQRISNRQSGGPRLNPSLRKKDVRSIARTVATAGVRAGSSLKNKTIVPSSEELASLKCPSPSGTGHGPHVTAIQWVREKEYMYLNDNSEMKSKVTEKCLPVWLSWEALRLFRERPTIATILAPMLERRLWPPGPRAPAAVSDWLPSLFSSEHMSPLMLVLLVMFFPAAPTCRLCILDVKTLEADGSLRVKTRVKGKRQKRDFRGNIWDRMEVYHLWGILWGLRFFKSQGHEWAFLLGVNLNMTMENGLSVSLLVSKKTPVCMARGRKGFMNNQWAVLQVKISFEAAV